MINKKFIKIDSYGIFFILPCRLVFTGTIGRGYYKRGYCDPAGQTFPKTNPFQSNPSNPSTDHERLSDNYFLKFGRG